MERLSKGGGINQIYPGEPFYVILFIDNLTIRYCYEHILYFGRKKVNGLDLLSQLSIISEPRKIRI